jgi:beta propeller repeat protein
MWIQLRGVSIQKQTKLVGLLAIALSVIVLFGGLTILPVDAAIQFNEFQITTSTASQEHPDIFGYRIVYQDSRNGNWDIYMYTVQGVSPPEARVTTNAANQIAPSIYGDLIVYQDDRNGNWDIYMYNLTSQTETRITTNNSTQQSPEIWGTRMVWEDYRNGNPNIYVYDLTTHTETRLTTTSSREPSISDRRVAYEKMVSSGASWYTVYYYDLQTGVESSIPGYSGQNHNPEVYGGRIVWDSLHSWDLFTQNEMALLDVTTGSIWETNNATNEENPDIFEYYVVYQSDQWIGTREGAYTWDIYLYNMDLQVISRVTNNSANQFDPAIYGGRIVYTDDRNGNLDIYMTMLSYTPMASSGPPEGSSRTSPTSPTLGLAVVIIVALAAVGTVVGIEYYTRDKTRPI